MILLRSACVGILAAFLCAGASAQFSPGELSRAHAQLEGSTNCSKCHEIGKTISGDKCLECHGEIAVQRKANLGYHGTMQSRQCVECHKEHLGRSARTMKFDSTRFDHASTGFLRAGKHAALACAQCHNRAAIRDPDLAARLNEYPHRTYLGLQPACAKCHPDPHDPPVQRPCSSCHDEQSWSKILATFNHSSTRYPLEGKHNTVGCDRCHDAFTAYAKNGKAGFRTKPFADCTPCHASPHAMKMASDCKSCHMPQDWRRMTGRPFDHSSTGFALRGRHATLRCEQCHGRKTTPGTLTGNLLRRNKCADCHVDPHHGVFLKTYANDCGACHTEEGYVPSTFTIARHDSIRFALDGPHAAVQCRECHVPAGEKLFQFAFSGIRCGSCHADIHRGNFKNTIAETGCEACHRPADWKMVRFDHAGTGFPLQGKHAETACMKCHAANAGAGQAAAAAGAPIKPCESCHPDTHRSQFVADGKTDCSRCHVPDGWNRVAFDHEKQSAFPLTGAHKKIACAQCHRQVTEGPVTFMRFKPLDGRCESCHLAMKSGDTGGRS